MKKILVIGATGSIGELVVKEALKHKLDVRALVRDKERAKSKLPFDAELYIGDATDESVLAAAASDVDGIILTHSAHGPRSAIEEVDYGVVNKLLGVISGRRMHIVLMTSFGVTAPEQPQNIELGILDWKRRSERLVRLSGQPYTIVRPGWFDYNAQDERSIVFLQGDPLRSGTPQAGRIARDQIARVLVSSLLIRQARNKTFELIAEQGAEQVSLVSLYSRLLPDVAHAADGILDPDTLPLLNEPARVLEDMNKVSSLRP